ncbi:MAG: glycosyltransferase family 87 protein [Planctomycetota bacterium]
MPQIFAGSVWQRTLVTILFLMAASLCVSRGVVRSMSSSGDFALIYAASHTWLTGGNPYDETQQLEAVSAANRPGAFPGRQLLSLYPPTTYALIAPFAVGSWPTARVAWISANLVLLALLIIAATRLGELSLTGWRGAWMVILLLAFAPVHTGLAAGQLAIGTVCAVAWAFWLMRSRRDFAAGLLLGLAVALKPQVAGPFLIIPLVRARWRVLATAGAVVVLISLIAVAVMQRHGIPWFESFVSNIAAFGRGSVGDPGPGNPARYQLINLAYPATVVFGQTPVVGLFVAAVVLVLLYGAAVRVVRGRGVDDELLALSLLALVSLLAVYHRAYDAVLLVFALAWCLRRIGRGAPKTVWASLAMCLMFLVPGPSMLARFADEGLIGTGIAGSWWWQAIALPHEAWALLVLAGLLWFAPPADQGSDGTAHASG